MIALRGVVVAAILIFGTQRVQSIDENIQGSVTPAPEASGFDLFSSFKSAFGGLGSLISGGSSKKSDDTPVISKDAGADFNFDMPNIDESKAAFVHSSSNHKSHVKNSGSSSASSSKVVKNADGKIESVSSSDAKGYDKESKLDDEKESLDQRLADGSVIHKDASKNQSSVDDKDYALKKFNSLKSDKNGNVEKVDLSSGGNHSRSAALDEAQNNENIKGSDGSHIVRSSGHKKSDEDTHNVDFNNSEKSSLKDGNAKVEKHHSFADVKGKKAEDNDWNNNMEDDGKGNLKVDNKSSNKSSASGSSNVVKQDEIGVLNKDGTSFSNKTLDTANGTYANAAASQSATKLRKNADGTSSLDVEQKGSKSADSNFVRAQANDVAKKNADGSEVQTSLRLGENGTASSASESGMSLSQAIGLNGAKSEKKSAFDKSREDNTHALTGAASSSSRNADGSVSLMKKDMAENSSDSKRTDNASESDLSDDGKGNVKKSSKDRKYKNAKSALNKKIDELEYSKDAKGNEHKKKSSQEGNKNTYEAERSANEKNSVKNADGTFSESNKGSESKVSRGDSSLKKSSQSEDNLADGTKTVSKDESAVSSNVSDASSKQYDQLHSKDANGAELLSNKESNQASRFNNQKESGASLKSMVGANGVVMNSASQSKKEHNSAEDSSNDKNYSKLKKADGSLVESDAVSAQKVVSGSDTASGKSSSYKKGADGSIVKVNDDFNTNKDHRSATDDRQRKFYNKDKNGNLQIDLKKSAVSEDTAHDASAVNHSADETGADGSHKVVQSSLNSNHSSLKARDVASDQGKLQMANGNVVINNKVSDISRDKSIANENNKKLSAGSSKDGKTYEIKSDDVSHSDLDKRGEKVQDMKYQKIGGKESKMDKGHVKTQAKGSSNSHSSSSDVKDDGKGNVSNSHDNKDSNNVINENDLVAHDKTVVA